jgi:Zn-dependent protease with chaperone function
MNATQQLSKALKKHGAITLLCLFLIPVFSYWFSIHVENVWSGELQRMAVEQSGANIPADELAGFTVANICESTGETHDQLCGFMSSLWQFHAARKLSAYTILLGMLTVLLIAVLPSIAYRKTNLQLPMFSLGWWSLRAISALEVLAQGVLLVWLSYWLTAYFLDFYAPKLIIIVVAIVGFAIFAAIAAIFRKAQMHNNVAGELIAESRAPQLWSRIKQLASTIGTPPPQHLIAGIDANFFVTEVPVTLHTESGQQQLGGRSLFVSLPLLRMLSQQEADAVLSHELAHFAGGDTQYSAQLGPKQAQFDQYTGQMGESSGLALVAFYILSLFRAAFEFALSRDSRQREFLADSTAARVVSANAVISSLIKITAYSNYRNEVENSLFDSQQKHEGALNVSQRVAHGLLDSHPALDQRMKNLSCLIDMNQYAGLINAPVENNWTQFIDNVEQLESPQWKRYEQDFSEQHEMSLAYRYEPVGEEQIALVEKYFPPVRFNLKKEQVVDITYAGIADSKSGEFIEWDRVKDLQYEDGNFGTADVLTITHPEKGMIGTAKTTKLKLSIDSKERVLFKMVLSKYWHRHDAMRAQAPSLSA